MENTNTCSQCNESLSIIKNLYIGNDDTELLCDICYTQCHGAAPSLDLLKISDNDNEELSNQVASLEDLLSLDKNNVAPTFADSIQSIFRYSVKDISDIIDKFDTDIVMSIHKAAVQRFQQKFADYQTCKPKHRRVKNSCIPDIIAIGLSIANNTVMSDADKAFMKTPTETDTPTPTVPNAAGEQQSMVSLMTKLQDITHKMTQLQNQVNQLKKDNEDLKLKVTNMNNITQSESVIPPVAEASPPVSPSITNLQTQSITTEYGESSDSEGFVFNRLQNRRQIRQKKKVRKLVTINTENKVPAAPAAASTLQSNKNQKKQPDKNLRINKDNSPQTKDVWIGGVHPTCVCEDIKGQLEGNGISDSTVTWLATTNRGSSFKVTVPHQKYDHALDHSKWPKGIISRPYRPKRKQISNLRASSSTRPSMGDTLPHNHGNRQSFRGNPHDNKQRSKPFQGHNNQFQRKHNNNKQYATNTYQHKGPQHRQNTTSHIEQAQFIPTQFQWNNEAYNAAWPTLPRSNGLQHSTWSQPIIPYTHFFR